MNSYFMHTCEITHIYELTYKYTRLLCYTVSYKAILLCLRCTEVSRHLGWAKLAVGGSEYHAHATGFEWMMQGCERKQRIICVLQHLLYYTPILTAIYNMTRYSI